MILSYLLKLDIAATCILIFQYINTGLQRLFLSVVQAENLKGLPFRVNRVTG